MPDRGAEDACEEVYIVTLKILGLSVLANSDEGTELGGVLQGL